MFNEKLVLLLFFGSLWLPTVEAADILQSEAMGGVTTALRSEETGFRLNPAALVEAQDNLAVFHLSASNWDYEDLGETEQARFTGMLSGRLAPSCYYTRGLGDYGFSIGYRADLDNRAQLSLLETQSTYFVNEQRFQSNTDLPLFYETLWEREWIFSVGYRMRSMDVGLRLRRLTQTAKRGELSPSLSLHAQLEGDVNPNKADEVIPAIMDDLDYDEDALQRPEDRVEQDLTLGAWDLDLGLQTAWFAQRFDLEGLMVGVLLENLFQRRRVTSSPARLSLGASWPALRWLSAVLEVDKRFGTAGLDLGIGWEAHTTWQQGRSGRIAFRNGWSHRENVSRFSVGFALTLGTASWEYSLSKRMQGESLAEATHLLASTIRF